MVGQASCDERGRYVGGQAGNQSGTELNARAAYLYGWHSLIRFTDAGRAKRCGAAMAAAVANMRIGYDQGERNTLLPLARAAGWDLSAVAKACECDCSSLAGVCGIAAGAPESALFVDGNLCYTGNIVERFASTGLARVYTGADYVKSFEKWQVGDILVSNGHVVVVIAGADAGAGGAGVAVTGSMDELARAVIAGRFGDGDERRAALGSRYGEVQARVNELLERTPNAAGASAGVWRIIAGEYKVVCDTLNVRSTPSRKKEPVAKYTRGQRIYGIAAEVVVAEGYVWAHYVARSRNVRYVALGTNDGREKYIAKT